MDRQDQEDSRVTVRLNRLIPHTYLAVPTPAALLDDLVWSSLGTSPYLFANRM